MSYADAASAYRQLGARGATPVGLVVLLYDAALDSLYAALRAMERNNVEQRTARLNHMMTILGVLESALNYEQGGEVAQRLGEFYRLTRGRILQAGIESSPDLLRQTASQFASLRDAWKQVERLSEPGASPSDTASALARTETSQPASRGSV